MTVAELPTILEDGQGFDGSSIEGFARIDESDMVARPDPDTWQVLPWTVGEGGTVARMFCNIHHPGGRPYEGDPRYVLRRALAHAADLGYTYYVGPELEFFLFKSADPPAEPGAPWPEVLDRGGYFDLTPRDVASDVRNEAVLALEALGIGVESTHHEVAPSQHEIDLRYTDALTMADAVVTTRLVVKEIALKNGLHATFMPKPLFGETGSGMHSHLSLFRGERNAFHDGRDRNHLSKAAKQFVAGLLRHAAEVTLVTNQWVNSYKRLVPGFEAPVYVSWAMRNRSDLVRIPVLKPGKEVATRVEYRAPDPACNPYLAFAVLLEAGLEGLREGYDLPPPVEGNVYEMTPEERREAGIVSLPKDLSEAIKAAEESELLRRTLGDHVFEKLLENKRIEWDRYRARVTRYELEQYLGRL